MAHKKGGGSTKNGRDSIYLLQKGIKYDIIKLN